jgi:hypothetical protein
MAALAGVTAALAIAAPIGDASAATTPGAGHPFTDWASLPAFGGPWGFAWPPLTFVGPEIGYSAYARGPTVINDVFNGATIVQVVNGGAFSSVVGSP